MVLTIRKGKNFLCALFLVLAAFMYNVLAEEMYVLSEKTFNELAELRHISSEANDEVNRAVIEKAPSFPLCTHKILPRRTTSNNGILIQKSREDVNTGQKFLYASEALAAAVFSDFSTHLFSSFYLSFNVVQRK